MATDEEMVERELGREVTVTLTVRECGMAADACSDAAIAEKKPESKVRFHRLAAEMYRAAGMPVLADEEEGLANE